MNSYLQYCKPLFQLILACFAANHLFAQGTEYSVSESESYWIRKIETESGRLLNTHTAILPSSDGRLIHELMDRYMNYFNSDEELDTNAYNRLVLLHEFYPRSVSHPVLSSLAHLNSFKTHWKNLYQYRSHLFSYTSPHFFIHFNPLLELKTGIGGDRRTFINRRGIQLSGGIDKKVFFDSKIIETQCQLPGYTDDYVSVYATLLGANFLKNYNSKIFKVTKGYDFLNAEASVAFRASKHIDIRLGHGRNKIGSGLRSLFLSDDAAPYFYLKINTQIWKLNYQNLFAELSPESKYLNTDYLLDKKYMAAHYLSCNLTKNWNIGIFESVIFSRKNRFDFQYLNPVILYRSVEQALGSPDNVLLGGSSRLILFKKIQLYTQLMLDEFVFKEVIRNNRGWWANKYGIQFGANYHHAFGIKNLELLAEYNSVRPYTYSFRDSLANYSHFNQSLAHPLGANFKEILLGLNYLIGKNLFVQIKINQFSKGLDSLNTNYGGNILLSHESRIKEYDNFTTQGIKQKVLFSQINLSYHLAYNVQLDLDYFYRKTETDSRKTSQWLQFGIRWNLDRLKMNF
ncbi:MAG TPA: hypothetical protein PK006_11020 [Saprospiraceae bacterium]|nr:hypothetical protein [Saprospiraceae bacterium]